MHRDSYASAVGHPAILSYLAIAEEKPKWIVRQELIEKMVRPCGPAPEQ